MNKIDLAHDVLYTAKAVFPFDLVPDSIIIDREKVTIVHRSFFRTAKISTTQVKDILNIESNVGPFFGSIRLTSRFFVNNPQIVNFLTRQDAANIQRLVQGYTIAMQKDIDCSDVEKEELIVLLDDLGRGTAD